MLAVSETNLPESSSSAFSIIKHDKTTFYVRNKYKDVLLSLDIDFLRKEALEKGNVRSGREPHAVIHIPELANERIIIRHSRHGGLFGYIAGDIFCKGNRFINELIASETAIENGVNTAEIIGVIKQRVFGLFYRFDVLSKEISNSLDLVELLTNPSLVYSLVGAGLKPAPTFTDRKNIIKVVAQTVRKMHDAGLYHTDLHLKNILIRSASGDTPPSPIPSIKRGERGVLREEREVCEFKAYIIDMDKAKRMKAVSAKLRMRNLSRLDRSVEKLKACLSANKVAAPPEADSLRKTAQPKGCGYHFHPHPSLPPRGGGLRREGYESLIPNKTDKLRFLMAYINGDIEMKQWIRMPPRTYWLHRLLWRTPFLKRAR